MMVAVATNVHVLLTTAAWHARRPSGYPVSNCGHRVITAAASSWTQCRAVLGIPHTRRVSQSLTLAARHERTPETPDPEMPYSAAHEAFVDDLLFAVVEVRIDEGQPLAVIS